MVVVVMIGVQVIKVVEVVALLGAQFRGCLTVFRRLIVALLVQSQMVRACK